MGARPTDACPVPACPVPACPVHVRVRRPADLEGCVRVLEEVRRVDGYPSGTADLAAFLAPPYEVGAWAAVGGDAAVVGHVAFHDPPESPTVTLAARATGRPHQDHVLLSRLFVGPSARRGGVARALLRTAADAARAGGRRAVLDVDQAAGGAVGLYESEGWRRAGADRRRWGPRTADVWVYVAP